jgi:hypothetical protein
VERDNVGSDDDDGGRRLGDGDGVAVEVGRVVF